MADIELTRSHSKGLDGGRTAVEHVAQQLETDLEVDYQWEGDTLRFSGAGADGTIEVDADAVQVRINLSAFLQPLKGRLEEEADQYLEQYLDEE